MLRLAAAALLAIVVAFPLTALPAGPVAWLAGLALVLGGAGIVALSVTLVTIGGSLALVAYALTLVIARPAVDPVAAAALGAALVLLLACVHLAAHVDGAAVDRAVVARQVRGWLAVVALGVGAAGALTAGATGAGGGTARRDAAGGRGRRRARRGADGGRHHRAGDGADTPLTTAVALPPERPRVGLGRPRLDGVDLALPCSVLSRQIDDR